MKSLKLFLLLGVFLSSLDDELRAQQSTNTNQRLDKRHEAVVTISAFTAKGDLTRLKKALIEGLDAGLTVNEIKEVLVQLYAYAGFPRSLNALHKFMEVIKERKAKGIDDKTGKEATPFSKTINKQQFGTEMQTKLVGSPVKGEVYEFAPAIDQFLKEHLFGDIFGRDNLDWKTRELATISALAVLGGVESQLRAHFNVGMHNGLTGEQLVQLISIIRDNVGEKEASDAEKVLREVLKSK